jgi:23S rRNA (uracil-5-)-methyltransferase RumA
MGVADVEVVVGQTYGYRHRVRLAVRGRAANPKLGLFEEGTHQIVDIPECLTHHPRINEVARWLKQHLRRAKVPPYSDAHHAGLLRYGQLALERRSQRVQVVLVGNCQHIDPLSPFFAQLRADAPDGLHSLVFNGHPERSNAVFGPHWHIHSGEPYLVDETGGAAVYYPPGAFSQANPLLFDRLVGEIHDWVGTGAHLVELYCGVGAIGLGLAARAQHVVFNEISPRSLDGLGRGLRELARLHSSLPPIDVIPGDAAAALALVGSATTVIVDPPRKGLEPTVLAGLCERRPRRLVYVSCGFSAFKRDAGTLVRAGYKLGRIRAFALFPFTEHVETLADFVLERG